MRPTRFLHTTQTQIDVTTRQYMLLVTTAIHCQCLRYNSELQVVGPGVVSTRGLGQIFLMVQFSDSMREAVLQSTTFCYLESLFPGLHVDGANRPPAVIANKMKHQRCNHCGFLFCCIIVFIDANIVPCTSSAATTAK